MKKVLLFAFVFMFIVTISSSACIFSQGNVKADDKMFEEFTLMGDPDFDLEIFAKKNDLNKKEAKRILLKKFGDPKQPDEKFFMEIAKSGNPDVDLENFALEHNIAKDDAREILKKMFGEPELP